MERYSNIVKAAVLEITETGLGRVFCYDGKITLSILLTY